MHQFVTISECKMESVFIFGENSLHKKKLNEPPNYTPPVLYNI